MASAARAYSSQQQYRRYDAYGTYGAYDTYEAYEQPRPRRSNIEVHPGKRKETQAAANRAVFICKIALVIIAVLAIMCIARIRLINASMDTLAQASEINNSIDEAKSLGTQLEVQYYAAANPNKVKSYASENLGMSAASVSGTTVDLTPDVIKEAIPSTVTGGIAVCESAMAERAAQTQAQAEANGAQAQAESETQAQAGAEAATGDAAQTENASLSTEQNANVN